MAEEVEEQLQDWNDLGCLANDGWYQLR
jgi:hypothetical protein